MKTVLEREKNTSSPFIFEIKGNSLDDGPGIRSVVFFKGCPLSCIWCHNPESKKSGPEISYDAEVCVGCNSCIDNCNSHAISRDNSYYVDRSKCNLCFECVNNCPTGALNKVGRKMAIEEVVEEIIKDRAFFDASGGGATLSGGEATLFMDYVSTLLKRLREEGVHTLLETCGLFDWNRFERCVLPYLDMIYYDIKLIDPESHKHFCGYSNERILRNFFRLLEATKNYGIEVLPRIPLVPGITDMDLNLKSIARLLRQNKATKASLLPYNPMWHEKKRSLGIEDNYQKNKQMEKLMSNEIIARSRDIFESNGITTSI